MVPRGAPRAAGVRVARDERLRESQGEIGRSGVVRAQILGFALPPESLQPRALLEGNISCFGPPKREMRSRSQSSRSPDLPVKSAGIRDERSESAWPEAPLSAASARLCLETLRKFLRFELRRGSHQKQ